MQEILSVGIDIGTATTQVVFSKLGIENIANIFSAPWADIVERKIIYQSGIHLTPLESTTRIDGEAVRKIVELEYLRAGIKFSDVQTGAVIVTGETACKENAEHVLKKLSGLAGDFVIYTAGPDLESIIAGKGSGAQAYSKAHSCTVANLDIGGGTTNIAVFRYGELITCGCLDIGGRLIRFDDRRIPVYISPRIKLITESLGIPLMKGVPIDTATLEAIVIRMNKILEQALGFEKPDSLCMALTTAGSSQLVPPESIDYLCFSGGVGDLITNKQKDHFLYSDIGVLLGNAIAKGLAIKAQVIYNHETIRATVIGAGMYTLSVSGSTICYHKDVLPQRNLPVLCISAEDEKILFTSLGGKYLAEKIKWFLQQFSCENLLMALKGKPNPSYTDILNLADSILEGTAALKKGVPLIVSLESDTAQALGQQIDWRLKEARSIVCVDRIKVSPGDYVDIGSPLLGGLTIPIVIKTLLFSS